MGSGPDPQLIRLIHRVCLVAALVGLVLIGVDLFGQHGQQDWRQDESMRHSNGLYRFAGIGLLAVALLLWTVIFLTSRCPFCGKWVHPLYRSHPTRHCQECGKKFSGQ